jgi:two-component sensor histidine kinase
MDRKNPRSIRSRLTLALSILLLPAVAYLVTTGWSMAEAPGATRALSVFGPIALWLIALIVVWFATDWQIGRPIRRLSRATEAYSRGDLSIRPAIAGPAELRALAANFNEMADKIAGRERELREAVETREAMLREIHHRVKNNLQIVTSLLNLQAKSVQGDSGQKAFNDIQTRVRALALVHRYLYESDDLQSVNLGAFLQELAASIQLSHGISQSQVAIEVEADAVWDVSDRAVPLALFMTEAMTNALKHAFPQGRQGVIRIVLKSLPQGVVRFSVEDNGVGLTEAQEIAQGGQPSLGMSLIKAFARQVDGKLAISGPPGTIVMIEFVNKYAAPQPAPEGQKRAKDHQPN